MRHAPLALLLLVLLGALGCVREQVKGDVSRFTFEPWTYQSILAVSVVALLGGIALYKRVFKVAIFLILMGAFGGVLIVPAMARDYAEVTPDGFRTSVGFWFAPTEHNVPFNELSHIEVRKRVRHTRAGRRTDVDLVCYHLRRDPIEVPVGDLLSRGPAERILTAARAYGLEVEGGL